METLGTFLAGFAVGWVVRSGADSSRRVAVAALATAYEIADRARHWAAIEREHLEDLVAEARAEYEARRVSANADADADADVEAETDAESEPAPAPRARRPRAA